MLELGAGTALPGLLAAKLGCKVRASSLFTFNEKPSATLSMSVNYFQNAKMSRKIRFQLVRTQSLYIGSSF